MTNNYKLADHAFTLDSMHEAVHKMFVDYQTTDEAEFTVTTAQSDIDFEREKADSDNYTDAYLETVAVYRKLCEKLVEYDVVLFHCSCLEIDGVAYLFTASSGTGKSTHTRLWREYFGSRVTMINDDKPLLKVDEQGLVVYGTPYSGKNNMHTNISAKVGGIVILHQAAENSIRRITAKEAYPLLFSQTHRPKDTEKLFHMMELVHIIANQKVFSLGCNISAEAVEVCYNALKSEQ